MNEGIDFTVSSISQEQLLGTEYERWLDEVEAAMASCAEIAEWESGGGDGGVGGVPWEGRRTIFIDDFPVREDDDDDTEDEEDDLIF